MPAAPVKLFLSYGRADASALADRLMRDLAAQAGTVQRGYAPWTDRVALVAGRPWAEQIADALRDTDVVLALMSPHSVRSRADGRSSDDSVCLDEIAFARFHARKPIVPVLVAPCTPPLDLFRLEMVDFTQWKDEAAYAAAFARLLDALAAALRGELRLRSSVDRLQPWDFGPHLARKREHFVGRRWLFKALGLQLAGAPQAVLVTGGPGFGKSAFVAEYLHRNPGGRVLAFHCCQAESRLTLDAGRFVRSVAAMIASRHPAYEALLDQPQHRELLTEQACSADPGSAFEQGVLVPLERMGPPGPGRWVLVVDALDEAADAAADGAGLVQLLAERVQRLPAWLTLVATTRPERSVLDLFAGVRTIVVEPTDLANVRDLRRYVADRLAEPVLQPALQGSGRKPAWVAARIGDAAEGNFLYAEQALQALQQGLLGVDELGPDTLPPGLTRQYRLFFGRRFGTDARWNAVRPLLAVLAAAQAPLPDAQLAAAAGLATGAPLKRALASIEVYLRRTSAQPPGRFLFHRSLLEWLTGPDEEGGRFAIDPRDGHLRLADSLLAAYRADRFQLSPYALAHAATHLAEAARADAAGRVERQQALAGFVLDPLVQQQRLADPFGMEAALQQALRCVAGGPPVASVPVALRLALGLEAFRRERLDAKRVFQLAAEGQVAQAVRELQLYVADEPWMNAARLLVAWLALPRDRDAASELRAGVRTSTLLDEHVDAAFEQRTPQVPPLTEPADLLAVTQILQQAGGNTEGVNPSMLWDQAEPPAPGQGGDAEGTRYLAEFQAPVMVAFAQREPVPGEDKLREYIALNAANAYRVYRNGTLWQILRAVARHPDPDWVRRWACTLVAAALAARGWEFGGAAGIAARALRVAAGGDAAAFDAELAQALHAADALVDERGRGDAWGASRRTLAAHAAARQHVLGQDAEPLLQRALNLPPGYAGFQVPACLDLAATLAACGQPALVPQALAEAERAAHNVQDLVFCARSVSRVHALQWHWHQAATADTLAIVSTARRLADDASAREFAAVHRVGEQYLKRQVVNPTSRLPAWLLQAGSLWALARVYQWRLADWRRVNPDLADADAPLTAGQPVRVPDPRFGPHWAAWFAWRVLGAAGLLRDERVATVLRLLPVAVQDRTELDAVIAALLLAWAPADAQALQQVDDALASQPLPEMARAAGPEPVA